MRDLPAADDRAGDHKHRRRVIYSAVMNLKKRINYL